MAKSSSDSKSTAKSLRQQVRDYISQQGHGTFNYKQVAAPSVSTHSRNCAV